MTELTLASCGHSWSRRVRAWSRRKQPGSANRCTCACLQCQPVASVAMLSFCLSVHKHPSSSRCLDVGRSCCAVHAIYNAGMPVCMNILCAHTAVASLPVSVVGLCAWREHQYKVIACSQTKQQRGRQRRKQRISD